jgi:hypothetical protein
VMTGLGRPTGVVSRNGDSVMTGLGRPMAATTATAPHRLLSATPKARRLLPRTRAIHSRPPVCRSCGGAAACVVGVVGCVVGVGVGVTVGVTVGVGVGVTVGVTVGVGLGDGDGDGDGVRVGDGDGDGVHVGDGDGDGVHVLVCVGDGLQLLVGAAVGVPQPTDADAVAGRAARQAMDTTTIAVVLLMAPPHLASTERTLGIRQRQGRFA